MTRFAKFLALGAAERGVFLCSLMALPCVAAVLSWRGLAAAQALAGRLPAVGAEAVVPASAARLVNAAAALTGASCLARSLVLCRFLRGRGPILRLGIARPATGGIAAHAWVELDGQPLNDGPDVRGRFDALEPGTSGRIP